MTNQNPKSAGGGERRLDPELLKKGLRCDLDQYEMLKRCSDKKDMTEWHEWRLKHQREEIWLEGADLTRAYLELVDLGKGHLERANLAFTNLADANLYQADLKGVSLDMANLQSASLQEANLQGAFIPLANLEGAHLIKAILKNAHVAGANLRGAILRGADLEGANLETALVDGGTLISKCKINRYLKNKLFTNFAGVGLDSCRIDPGAKQLLEYNIRRMNWEEWYSKGSWWRRILKRLFVQPFWLISDYGLSTGRIIVSFFALGFFFAIIYYLCGRIAAPGIVENLFVDRSGIMVPSCLVPLRTLYFSIVTMTTLGFGDMYANAQSIWGHILLSVQVIFGYVLLGALVTRFAVLFTAGGPAGKFAD